MARPRRHRLALLLLAQLAPFAFGATPSSSAAAAAEESEALFVRRVWPLLQQKCLPCHGDDPAKIKGGLDLRTHPSALEGGNSDQPAFVAGQPDRSPLYLATLRNHADWEPMPPKEPDQLSAAQIDWLRQWIVGGAPWPDAASQKKLAAAHAKKNPPDDGVTMPTSGGLSADWTNRRYKPEGLWAYQPVKKPAIPPRPLAHAPTAPATTNPIDAFLAARLPPGLATAPTADARTFIRRATFDLTGLPPTPEEIAAFDSAHRANPPAAVRDLIDRLLASPHYGERMAQHWLDVVRYADSSGFANDYERGNAWRYRDYVVRSFNADLPYDRFIREQIAGDELADSSPPSPPNAQPSAPTSPPSAPHTQSAAPNFPPSAQNSDRLIATGFLRMGPWELTGMEVAKVARQRFLDDVTNAVGETFLAHSLQCARCHDHKFDPIPTRDYYALQAVFATTQLSERPAPFLPAENTAGFEEAAYLEPRRADYVATLQRLDVQLLTAAEKWFADQKLDLTNWHAAVTQARTQERATKRRDFEGIFNAARAILTRQKIPEEQFPPKLVGFSPEDYGNERVARKGLERLRWELERYEPFALAVYNGRTPDVKSVNAPLRMPPTRLTVGELEETCILTGGDPFAAGEKVAPGVLSVLGSLQKTPVPTTIEGRRRALAEWIADPANPLTTRTFVNRVWLWHFGRPLAGNPNNFGSTGQKPTHPELLDWLTATFVEQGWSLKALHRAIMTSDAYARSATHPDRAALAALDPTGTSYAVFAPRRLTAEELRDAQLAATGELNRTLGGIPNRPEMNLEAALQPRQVMGTFASAWIPNPLPAQRHRRSLYALKLRGLPDPAMEVFNQPTPDFSCERRDAATITPQVFSLFNSAASHSRALALAARAVRETNSESAALTRCFTLALARPPTAPELAACLAHWNEVATLHTATPPSPIVPPRAVRRDAVEENTGEKFSFQETLHAAADFVPDLAPADVPLRTRALADVCLALFNTNEFAYVD